jgi:hypothetical protein
MDAQRAEADSATWWQRLEFWPTRAERWFDAYWFVPFVLPVVVVAALERLTQDAVWVMRDPYVTSLYGSLVLSACAFKWWQRSFRKTFGAAVSRGFVADDPESTKEYLEYSTKLQGWLESPWRRLSMALFVAFAAILTLGDLPAAVSGEGVRSIYIVAYVTFLMWAYGVGAATWCLLVCTYWIWKLPSCVRVVFVPGHPDGCGGVEPIGRCCFRAVIPLLIGVTLACAWSLSQSVPFFRLYAEDWLALIVPTSTVLMIALASLSVALVVFPLRKFHGLMSRVNEDRENTYAARIRKLQQDLNRMVKQGDPTQATLEELKLAGEMAPSTFPMGDWPFNSDVAIKYGSGPALSIAASLGKQLLDVVQRVG